MVVKQVISRHSEECAFLWLLRTGAVAAPHYGMHDLAKLDTRVDAHLDGLRIAGEAGWEVVEKELGWKEAGEFFVASVLAYESGNRGRIDAVLAKLGGAAEGLSGVASALGWLAFEQAKPWITQFLASDDKLLLRAGLTAAAICRHNPGPALGKALADSDARLRARALRAAGELGRTETISTLRTKMNADDPPSRFWAAWSLVLLSNDSSAIAALRQMVDSSPVYRDRAAAMFARRADAKAVKDWCRARTSKPAQARAAIAAAGALGDVEVVHWLLDLMKQKPLARPAGEAFTFITGADLARLDLETKPPADFASGPTDDPADEDVAVDPDDNLPWPDPDLVARWWQANSSRFSPDTRYLLGKPMNPENLREVLRIGKQRHRAAAAIELSIRAPGTPLFETRMPGFRQKQLLSQ